MIGPENQRQRPAAELVDDFGYRSFIVPHADGSVTVGDWCPDVSPLLDFNKSRQNDGHDYFTKDRSMVAIADIPLTVYTELRKLGIIGSNGRRTDQKALRRWLNDPDNRAFRIATLRL